MRIWALRGGDQSLPLYYGLNVLGKTGDLFPCEIAGLDVVSANVPVSIGSQLIKSAAVEAISEPLRSCIGGTAREIERLYIANGFAILVGDQDGENQ